MLDLLSIPQDAVGMAGNGARGTLPDFRAE
jgi:hypothetical protein